MKQASGKIKLSSGCVERQPELGAKSLEVWLSKGSSGWG